MGFKQSRIILSDGGGDRLLTLQQGFSIVNQHADTRDPSRTSKYPFHFVKDGLTMNASGDGPIARERAVARRPLR
jgi:hypothetical protein